MVNRRVAAAIICFVLLDDDEVKTRGKTRSWIKRRKQRGAFSNIVHELSKEDRKKCYEWTANGIYFTTRKLSWSSHNQS